MKAQRPSLTSYFPSLIDIAKARKDGFPCYTIQHYFCFSFGTFQAFIDYQNDNYVVKYRGFNHSDYTSRWTICVVTPYQRRAIEVFTSLIMDYLDINPLLEDTVCPAPINSL